ncbi:hypothetical protein Tco_0706837 [Tanacetum coccineum]|uniref:Uncharacterized protein n=1 Tax=Tanacetum coccineum TaxID=301880 RepID=A0ABQ4YA43_9ASTR
MDLCTSLSKKVEGLESELKQTRQTYNTTLTKLILRVKEVRTYCEGRQILEDGKECEICLYEDDLEEILEIQEKISVELLDVLVTTYENLDIYKEGVQEEKASWKDIMQESELHKKVIKRLISKEETHGHVTEESRRLTRMNYFKGNEVRRTLDLYLNRWIKFYPLPPWILKNEKVVKKKVSRKKSLAGKGAEEFAIEIESLGTKYPIVDWKTHVLVENFMYYQIFRADGSSKNYKIFSEMLDDFDRQDVLDLHRLVLQSDVCGIHILLMDNGIAIHMMIENKYPLTQEMLLKMLSRKLEVDHGLTLTFLRMTGCSLLLSETGCFLTSRGGLLLLTLHEELADLYLLRRHVVLTSCGVKLLLNLL